MTHHDTLDEDALLSRLIGYFDSAAEASLTARRRAERDRDYYDGRQWTAAEESALKARGQAPIVVNRIKPKIDFLLGLERSLRTDPRCYPQNPTDEKAARAATQAIRFVLDSNDFDQIRSQAFENLLIEGTGFAEVVAQTTGSDTRVRLNVIPWDRFFVDPHARRRDLEDAKFRGQVIWLELNEALRRYPDKTDQLNAALSHTGTGTYDDKPSHWADRKRKRVRVVECWYKDGSNVYQAVFCKGGLLKKPTLSPYRNAHNQPEDPYVAAAAFITRDGERYGSVRQLIGVQDEINKRRSKALHLLSVRAEKGAVADVTRARKELARPDGWIETVPGFSLDVLPTGDMAQAQFQLLAEAKQEIDAVGPNAALSGKLGDGASGRAIQARQQGGTTEVGPQLDTLRAWQMRLYRKVWGQIRQFWTGSRWIRITDDPRNLAWVGLNRPVTVADELMKELGEIPQELQGDPTLNDVVRVENHIAELAVDIVVSDVPDTVSIRQEEFQTLARLAEGGMAIPPEALIEASGIRGKDKILAALQGDPDQARTAADQQADRDALERAALVQEILERQARAKKTEAEAAKILASLQRGERPANDAAQAPLNPVNPVGLIDPVVNGLVLQDPLTPPNPTDAAPNPGIPEAI